MKLYRIWHDQKSTLVIAIDRADFDDFYNYRVKIHGDFLNTTGVEEIPCMSTFEITYKK